MPKRFRLTSRFPCEMTEDDYHRLRKLPQEAGLDDGETTSFILINRREFQFTKLPLENFGHLVGQQDSNSTRTNLRNPWKGP